MRGVFQKNLSKSVGKPRKSKREQGGSTRKANGNGGWNMKIGTRGVNEINGLDAKKQ